MLSLERLNKEEKRVFNVILSHAPRIHTASVAKEAGVTAKQLAYVLRVMRVSGLKVERASIGVWRLTE